VVDPLPPGPVSRISRSASSTLAERQSVASATQQVEATTASASLPQLVTLAADLVRQGPPIDYARVAQIRQAIADGRYTIDTQSIAQSIMTFYGPRDA